MIQKQYFQTSIPSISDRTAWDHWAQSAQHATLRGIVEDLASTAPPRPVLPTASDYLAARRSNDRGRVDRIWQHDRAVLSALAFRRCLRGMDAKDSDDRLLDWLWEFVNQPTWVVSAHLPENDLPAGGSAQLDLAGCEMAMLLAETREALKPWVDLQSKTLGNTIAYEINRRVLTPFGEGAKAWWADVESDHHINWTGVCAGSILAACISLEAQGFPQPRAKSRAIDCLKCFFKKAFTPAGECDEGVHYWSYGVGFACLGLSRLPESEFRSLCQSDRVAQVADYPRIAHLFQDAFFSGNDAGSRARASLYFVPWLAQATDNLFLRQWADAHPGWDMRTFSQMVRCAETMDQNTVPTEKPLDRTREHGATLLQDQQVGIFHFSSNGKELIFCLTGGHNEERHNHNDLGHFIVTAGTDFVIPDLGAPYYKADFFGPRRYEYLCASSRGHCCPIINGQAQIPGKSAGAQIVSWNPASPELILDLTRAYPAEAKLRSWKRSATQGVGRILLADHFLTEAGVEIIEIFWSTFQPEIVGNKIILGPVVMLLEDPAQAISVETVDPRAHNLREWNNLQLYQILASYRANSKGELNIRVAISAT